MGETAMPSMGKVWPMWLIFGTISLAAAWIGSQWLARGKVCGVDRQASPSGSKIVTPAYQSRKHGRRSDRKCSQPIPHRENHIGGEPGHSAGWLIGWLRPPGPHGRWLGFTRLLFSLIAIFWLALFLHNSRYLVPDLRL